MSQKPNEALMQTVIDCAMEVHSVLGPGLLESTYEQCMASELRSLDLIFERQALLPVDYKNLRLNCGYRIDLLVENRLIVEIKSANRIQSVHMSQVATYMRLAKVKLGLIINFNVIQLRYGLRQIVLPESVPVCDNSFVRS